MSDSAFVLLMLVFLALAGLQGCREQITREMNAPETMEVER